MLDILYLRATFRKTDKGEEAHTLEVLRGDERVDELLAASAQHRMNLSTGACDRFDSQSSSSAKYERLTSKVLVVIKCFPAMRLVTSSSTMRQCALRARTGNRASCARAWCRHRARCRRQAEGACRAR